MYYTTYYVRALTAEPSVYHDSEPDSGYSIDNLAPVVVANFSVAYGTGGGNELAWDPASDSDFRFFRIYRDVTPDFTPGPGNEFHTTTGDNWTDAGGTNSHYYKIAAVDFSGNEGDPTGPDVTTGVEDQTPKAFALYQNVPNPFNPMTTIRYSLPEASDVTLVVYDAAGRRVRTLVDTAMPPGNQAAAWDGLDNDGKRVASGVYFYRLEAGSFVQTRRMVLIR
jgi:hypothetical protein